MQGKIAIPITDENFDEVLLAIKSHFTYGVVDLSWEGKRTGIQEVIYAEQNSYTNNR